MRNFMKTFLESEDGAITVDWVVLTAAVVGLAIAVIATIASGALDQSGSLGNRVDALSIQTY